ETLWGSMVKQTMIRKNPAFNESYYGFSTFSKLLEEAAKQKIVTLERDEKSGTYVITALTEEGGRAAEIEGRHGPPGRPEPPGHPGAWGPPHAQRVARRSKHRSSAGSARATCLTGKAAAGNRWGV